MKGTDWGRIVARVLSIVLVMRALSLAATILPLYLDSRKYRDEFDSYLTIQIVFVVVILLLAVIAWVFSHKFSPSKSEETEEPKDIGAAATVLIATVGMFFAYSQGGLALSEGLIKPFDVDAFKWEMQQPSFAFHMVTTALSVAIVVKSKAIATWMAK